MAREKKMTEANIEKAIKAVKSGKTMAEVAKGLDISMATLYAALPGGARTILTGIPPAAPAAPTYVTKEKALTHKPRPAAKKAAKPAAAKKPAAKKAAKK